MFSAKFTFCKGFKSGLILNKSFQVIFIKGPYSDIFAFSEVKKL